MWLRVYDLYLPKMVNGTPKNKYTMGTIFVQLYIINENLYKIIIIRKTKFARTICTYNRNNQNMFVNL